MAIDGFLQRDVPEYGDERQYRQSRDADDELPEREPEGDEGAIAEEHVGLTPPD